MEFYFYHNPMLLLTTTQLGFHFGRGPEGDLLKKGTAQIGC